MELENESNVFAEWINGLPSNLYSQMMAEAIAEAIRKKRGGYIPRGAVEKLFVGTSRECILSGAAGTGKSRGCLEYMHEMAMRHANSRLLIARKLRASLTETGLVTFEGEVLGDGHPLLRRPITRSGRRSYIYPNGAEIIVGGIDKTSKIMSSQYDFIYVQEATEITLSEWESLTTRLRNGKADNPRIIGDCNPSTPSHWIYQRDRKEGFEMIQTSHEDNPVLYDSINRTWTEAGEQYISILDSLTGVRKDRLRYGRWVVTEGSVYQVERAIHFVDGFVVPNDWKRFCSVDFGFHNPFVCGWWAVSPDGDLYLYRYIYKTNKLLEDILKDIQEINAATKERIEVYVCDHDSQEFEMMRARGFNVIRAYKDITTGIQAVQSRLKINLQTGKPRIYFMRDALIERDSILDDVKRVCTIEGEFDSYVWAKAETGKITQEVPVKDNDHAMDMIRYAVTWLDRTGRPDTGGTIVTIPLTMPHPLKTQAGQTTPSKRQLPPAIGRK